MTEHQPGTVLPRDTEAGFAQALDDDTEQMMNICKQVSLCLGCKMVVVVVCVWQDWALGVLHAKIIAAITLMGPQWWLKTVIEQVSLAAHLASLEHSCFKML